MVVLAAAAAAAMSNLAKYNEGKHRAM